MRDVIVMHDVAHAHTVLPALRFLVHDGRALRREQPYRRGGQPLRPGGSALILPPAVSRVFFWPIPAQIPGESGVTGLAIFAGLLYI